MNDNTISVFALTVQNGSTLLLNDSECIKDAITRWKSTQSEERLAELDEAFCSYALGEFRMLKKDYDTLPKTMVFNG